MRPTVKVYPCINRETLKPVWALRLHNGDRKPRWVAKDGTLMLFDDEIQAKQAAATIQADVRERSAADILADMRKRLATTQGEPK